MRRDRDEWGDGPDTEPREVEWEVWGTVDGKPVTSYIMATTADLAAEYFAAQYYENDVEVYGATISEYQ